VAPRVRVGCGRCRGEDQGEHEQHGEQSSQRAGDLLQGRRPDPALVAVPLDEAVLEHRTDPLHLLDPSDLSS
jgi:hypothetical protein